jgi:hypothetical protein
MTLLSDSISVLVVVLVASFGVYIVALSRMPKGRRPTPPVYDRLGHRLGWVENPDFRLNPGEDRVPRPKISRSPPR